MWCLKNYAGLKLTANKWIEVPADFVYTSKSSSTAEAFMLWTLLYAKERSQRPAESFGLFARSLNKKVDLVSLRLLYKAYEGYVDAATKGRCPLQMVYNSETLKCVKSSTAKKFRTVSAHPDAEVKAILDLSFDERFTKNIRVPMETSGWLTFA
ncbi:MAG: hypothetical protein EB015_22875 [Methylocystaceae bacterium]|nr:hypothetical protein [Methylocystaceae bacterium]